MKLFDLANFGDKATQRLTLYGNIITLVGDQGSCNINIKGRASDSDHIKVCEFDTDLTTTAENFVSDNYLYYKLHGFIITASAGVITVNPAYGWETVNNIIVEVSTYTAPASATTAAPTTTAAGTTTAAPVMTTLTGVVSGTFEVDFTKSRIWRMTTGIDITVADPVSPANGDRIRLELRCTAGVTINFSSKWDFVGVSNYSLVNSAFSVIEGVYDSTEDKVICEITTYESITTTAAPTTTAEAVSTTTGLPTTTVEATTALPTTTPLGGFLKDYDGNNYTTVIIGDQEWTVENLITTHYADGTAIPDLPLEPDWSAEDGTAGQDGALCVYGGVSANKAIYGYLYNWYAINNDKELVYFERGGVQEEGWRVPVAADFDTLFAAIGGKATSGGDLKEIGIVHWTTPNTGALDEYGFTALPGGLRNYSAPLSVFIGLNTDVYFGCSDVFDANNNYCARFVYNSAEAYQTAGSKKNGLSIRCVRDIGTTSQAPTTTASQTTLL